MSTRKLPDMSMRPLGRWLRHNFLRSSSDANAGSHTLAAWSGRMQLAKPLHDWKLLSVDLIAGLSRWSAVVRGAVDTGCRRNYSNPVVIH